MKLKLAALFLLSTAHLALAADPAVVAGKWQVHSITAGTENDSTCSFTQKQAELTGTCTDQNGAKDVTGKVDGMKVSWSFKSDYNGTPLTVNFDGTLAAGKMTGTVTVPEVSVEGEFTATQAK